MIAWEYLRAPRSQSAFPDAVKQPRCRIGVACRPQDLQGAVQGAVQGTVQGATLPPCARMPHHPAPGRNRGCSDEEDGRVRIADS
jgi:hypothetical protein